MVEPYTPQLPSLLDQFETDSTLTKEEYGFAVYQKLLLAKRNHEALFLVIGKLLKEIRDHRLYEVLDYDNFSQFINSDEVSFSREKAYMCIKVYEYYIEYLDLDPDRIGSMNISRLSMLVPVLKKIEDRTEAVKQIEEMDKLSHGDFVREVKKKTNRTGKPQVFWSDELDKWIITYFENNSHLHNLGLYEPETNQD